MASDLELSAMRQAITLSAHGLGTTSPNPPVGCVILDQRGTIVGADSTVVKESRTLKHTLSTRREVRLAGYGGRHA